jgi:hypothetical protein
MLLSSRRQFLRRNVLLPSLTCTLYEQTGTLLAEQTAASQQYDLLIRGGHVIDPSQDLSADVDIAIRQGKVARLASGIAEAEARQVLDARKMIVTPDSSMYMCTSMTASPR